jgi:hypothetical protein
MWTNPGDDPETGRAELHAGGAARSKFWVQQALSACTFAVFAMASVCTTSKQVFFYFPFLKITKERQGVPKDVVLFVIYI